MEIDFMGLNSKDTVLKKEAVAGSKNAYGYKAFNNHQEDKFQDAHFLQLNNDASLSSCSSRPEIRGGPVKPHLLGIPLPSAHLVRPLTGSFLSRKTQPCLKNDSGPGQLTIFYDGLVNVYDDISPNKARAIILMAGKGMSLSLETTPKPRAQVQGHTPADEPYLNQPTSTQPCLAVSSPVTVSSHPIGQVIQSVFPQARKASLARFLEKRKERVSASAPYSLGKSINSDDVAILSD